MSENLGILEPWWASTKSYKVNLSESKTGGCNIQLGAHPTSWDVSIVEVIPASTHVVESKEIKNVASNAIHNLESFLIDNVVEGTL